MLHFPPREEVPCHSFCWLSSLSAKSGPSKTEAEVLPDRFTAHILSCPVARCRQQDQQNIRPVPAGCPGNQTPNCQQLLLEQSRQLSTPAVPLTSPKMNCTVQIVEMESSWPLLQEQAKMAQLWYPLCVPAPISENYCAESMTRKGRWLSKSAASPGL